MITIRAAVEHASVDHSNLLAQLGTNYASRLPYADLPDEVGRPALRGLEASTCIIFAGEAD